jgi:undecaprenyl-diphosphatase
MIEIIKAIVLGLVEGVTEFLPISSTGHLIILNQWLAFEPSFTKLFDVVIQLGAVLAVVVYFWDRFWPFGKLPTQREEVFDIWKKTIVGVLPALVLGALFGKVIQERLFSPMVVAVMLILGGLVLLFIERRSLTSRVSSIREMGYGTVLLIGLVQCLAMIPGTSRSAATIVGGLFLGLSRVVATEFSFFLAVPTMVAASGYALLKSGASFGFEEAVVLVIGFLVSFVVAWLVIGTFLRYIQRNNFRIFGYYRIILGLIVLFFLAGR